VDQAAYRIVQEALTNTSRHAGKASASVHLHYAQGALTVQVNDDGEGTGTTSAGPGLGLIGMRERVSALGGRLHAGPQAGGGFQVRAELPVLA
jgi:signal transduction histidine kinase